MRPEFPSSVATRLARSGPRRSVATRLARSGPRRSVATRLARSGPRRSVATRLARSGPRCLVAARLASFRCLVAARLVESGPRRTVAARLAESGLRRTVAARLVESGPRCTVVARLARSGFRCLVAARLARSGSERTSVARIPKSGCRSAPHPNAPGQQGSGPAGHQHGPGHATTGLANSVEVPTSRGRGEFEPGDRTFWDLPKLGSVQEPNAAVRASDWLYRSALMLRDLSAKSWQWYDRVYEAALEYYRMYQEADPLKRGQIRPDLPSDLQNPVFARLEARAVSMLLNSVPESVSSQALATRSLSSVEIIYQVLKQFQPGGLMERQGLLKSLTELPVAGSGQEAVVTLQAWFRHVARARTMQVQLPDESILLAALGQHAHVAFRLNLSRHQLKLDYKAELETVEEYARSLLAEFEVLALSSGDPNPAKRQRVRKLKEQEVPPAPKEDSGPPPKRCWERSSFGYRGKGCRTPPSCHW